MENRIKNVILNDQFISSFNKNTIYRYNIHSEMWSDALSHQSPGVADGQGGLASCSSWGRSQRVGHD